MAKATIVIEDLDINVGTVTAKFSIDETGLDDGQVTAAHFFAKFIENGMSDPAFLEQVYTHAAGLFQQHQADKADSAMDKLTLLPANDEATDAAA